MFVDFKDVKKNITKNFPDYTHKRGDILLVNAEDASYSIRIFKPKPQDSYLDIVGQVIVYYNSEVLFNRLIHIDTDLDKLKDKIAQVLLYHQLFNITV